MRLDNSNDLAALNASFPSLIECILGRSIHHFCLSIHTNQWEWICSASIVIMVIGFIKIACKAFLTNINWLKWREIRHWESGIMECIVTQFYWLKLRKIYSSLSLNIHTNQWEWRCSAFVVIIVTVLANIACKAFLSNINGLKRRETWHFKRPCSFECPISQFYWLKLRKIYSSFLSFQPNQPMRMMMLRPHIRCNNSYWSTLVQSQWIGWMWDLLLWMIRYAKKTYHPTSLISILEDLFISSSSHTHQSMRMN